MDTHLQTTTCKHTLTHVYTHGQMFIRTCTPHKNVLACTNTHTWACPHVLTPTPHTHAHGHKVTCAHSLVSAHTCICTRCHTHMHPCVPTCIYAHAHRHSCMHVYTHVHKVTHTWTSTCRSCPAPRWRPLPGTHHPLRECDNLPSPLMPKVTFGVQMGAPVRFQGSSLQKPGEGKNVKAHLPVGVQRVGGTLPGSESIFPAWVKRSWVRLAGPPWPQEESTSSGARLTVCESLSADVSQVWSRG